MQQSSSALSPDRRSSRPSEGFANILGALIAGLTLTAPFIAIARFPNPSSHSPSFQNPAFQAPEFQNRALPEFQNRALKVPG